jgi:DNA sulfur modification protein DndC
MTSMISEGHSELAPLLSWRNWLVSIRDVPEFRCKRRRNGQPGLGPFTLSARRMILNQLLLAQRRCPWTLIQAREITKIKELWKADDDSAAYLALERE